MTLVELLLIGVAQVPGASSIAEKNNLYLTILFGAGATTAVGLIPLLIKAIPAIVKWREAREERRREIAAEPLKQIRADHESRLQDLRTLLERETAEHAKDVAEYHRLVEHLLRQNEQLRASSRPPKPPSSTSGTSRQG